MKLIGEILLCKLEKSPYHSIVLLQIGCIPLYNNILPDQVTVVSQQEEGSKVSLIQSKKVQQFFF